MLMLENDDLDKVMRAAARNFQPSCYVMTAALAPAVMAGTMTA